jgi:xanthine dehydrogenase accessory factor
MNEVQTLLDVFDTATAQGERCALATVVSVEGSSYRRPGARMLVCEGGSSAGAISAGCLEGDVIEHAQLVIRAGEARLVEYDTASTSDEMAWGLGLGCNGLVRVLVEPIKAGSPYVEALRRSCDARTDTAPVRVATVYRHTRPALAPSVERVEIGARLYLDDDGGVRHGKLGARWAARLEEEVRARFRGETTSGGRLRDADDGEVEFLVEVLLPPVSLVVFGAGQDVLPVVELARGLGWHTEVVDPQARPASRDRFAHADHITLARPEEVAEQVRITPRTVTLLMSHDYALDRSLLAFLLASPAAYIGVMGPRERTDRMLGELAASGGTTRPPDLARLHSPVGLDIGANSPAEVALSIVAEMRAVLDGRRGGMLRERRGSIHGGLREPRRVTSAGVPALCAVAA